jgi:hypothetical protein
MRIGPDRGRRERPRGEMRQEPVHRSDVSPVLIITKPGPIPRDNFHVERHARTPVAPRSASHPQRRRHQIPMPAGVSGPGGPVNR